MPRLPLRPGKRVGIRRYGFTGFFENHIAEGHHQNADKDNLCDDTHIDKRQKHDGRDAEKKQNGNQPAGREVEQGGKRRAKDHLKEERPQNKDGRGDGERDQQVVQVEQVRQAGVKPEQDEKKAADDKGQFRHDVLEGAEVGVEFVKIDDFQGKSVFEKRVVVHDQAEDQNNQQRRQMNQFGQRVNQDDGGHDDDVFDVMIDFVQQQGKPCAEQDGGHEGDDQFGEKTEHACSQRTAA